VRRLELMGSWAYPTGDDSSWEPDGVKRQVRFCVEPGTDGRMGEIAWHGRGTRRRTENTNFTLRDGKYPAYSPTRCLHQTKECFILPSLALSNQFETQYPPCVK
jgi:hypothetical protein